jgi:hypothetical protein
MRGSLRAWPPISPIDPQPGDRPEPVDDCSCPCHGLGVDVLLRQRGVRGGACRRACCCGSARRFIPVSSANLGAALPGVRQPVAPLRRHGSPALLRDRRCVAPHRSRHPNRHPACEGGGERRDSRLHRRSDVQGRRAHPPPDSPGDLHNAVLACLATTRVSRRQGRRQRPGVRGHREHGQQDALALRSVPRRLRINRVARGPATFRVRGFPGLSVSLRERDSFHQRPPGACAAHAGGAFTNPAVAGRELLAIPDKLGLPVKKALAPHPGGQRLGR